MTEAGPLSGITILDLTRVLAGPWATQLLADLGAEVIKIEHPHGGDDTRRWGPPWAISPDGGSRESAYFLAANRGKKSVAIDIARPDGAALVAELAMRCDALVENFKVGGLARYGLDFAALSARNPRLVYCSITGFGQDGPYAAKPGYDSIVQGMGGMMSVTGEPAGAPMKAGVAITDLFTGLYAANGIQAALRHRDRTGEGQHIDVALLDTQVAVMANVALNTLVSGDRPGRYGNAHASIVPYQAFETSDGAITVAVGNDAQFARFAEAIGLGALARDPIFATNEARVANRDRLIPLVQRQLLGGTAAHWLSALDTAAVPAGPIHAMDQVFDDPQVVHRGMAIETQHATLGTAPGVRAPLGFSHSVVGTARGAPILGGDTRAVLAERLGLGDAALARLASAGTIFGAA